MAKSEEQSEAAPFEELGKKSEEPNEAAHLKNYHKIESLHHKAKTFWETHSKLYLKKSQFYLLFL